MATMLTELNSIANELAFSREFTKDVNDYFAQLGEVEEDKFIAFREHRKAVRAAAKRAAKKSKRG